MTADATIRPRLVVLPSADDVSAAAAAEIARGLAVAIEERGVAHWATTGGSAAPGIYRALRVPPLRDAVDWDQVHVWWGDDRFVPADHPLSNVLPLMQVLLDTGGGETGSAANRADVAAAGAGVHLPVANLHAVPMRAAIGGGGGAAWGAAAYAGTGGALGPGGRRRARVGGGGVRGDDAVAGPRRGRIRGRGGQRAGLRRDRAGG